MDSFCVCKINKVVFVLDVTHATVNLQDLEVSWNNIPELDHHHCCFQEIILRVMALN